ncbi:MAG: hypothetical protein LC775_01735, partial [Acidobacteria bacterium]|nr:hypothetical protein [Acidobacteriota bacterium]
ASSSHLGRILALVILVVLLVGGVYLAVRYLPFAGTRQIASVAVLPLVNTTSDPDTQYLSDGVTDNIIERLSRIPALKVMSLSAVFHYKGKQIDPRTIARELGVEAVLTGRLMRRGDSVTINLELVDASDNSHIWGEQYDRKLSDLLVLQREIPLDVSEKLRVRLSGESRERLTRAYTSNAEAYQLYLKGRYAWEKWSLEGAKQAMGFFEEAIKQDPNYALAYAGLADVYLFGRFAGAGLPQNEAHRRGRDAAIRALALDPQLGEAHAALSQVLLYDDWDFAGAERELKLAIELNPAYGEGHHQYSHLLLLLGRVDEAFEQSRIFLDLDPVSEAPLGHLCYTYIYTRRYDEGIPHCLKDIQLYPDTVQGHTLAVAYYQKGMIRESFEQYLRALAQDGEPADVIAQYREAFNQSGMPGFYRQRVARIKTRTPVDEYAVQIAELYARLGETDQAFEWLEKAYSHHADGLLRLKEEIAFDSIRSDPRFGDLLRKIGLPQ